MISPGKYRPFCVAALTSGSPFVLLAGVAGVTIVVTYAKITCMLSNTGDIKIADTSQTTPIISLPGSFPLHGEAVSDFGLNGLALITGEALRFRSLGGVAAQVYAVVEGYQVL